MKKDLLNCKTYIEVAQYCKDNGFNFLGIDKYISELSGNIYKYRKCREKADLVLKWRKDYCTALGNREQGNRWAIVNEEFSLFLKGEDFEELQYSMKFHEKELRELFGEVMEPETFKIFCKALNQTISFKIHNIDDLNEIFDNNHELYEISNFRTTLDTIIVSYESDNEVETVKLLHKRAKEIDDAMDRGIGYIIWNIDNFKEDIIFIEGNSTGELLTSICQHPEVLKYQAIKCEPIKEEPAEETEEKFVPSF